MSAHDPIQYVELTAPDAEGVFVEAFDTWTEEPIDAPHRHAYHEVLWFTCGGGRHSIDGRAISIQPQTVALIAQGQVHAFQETDNLAGYAVCFTDSFLGPELARPDRSYRTLFNYLGGDQTLDLPTHERAAGVRLLDLIVSEYTRRPRPPTVDVLRHLIHALLFQIERVSRAASQASTSSASEQQRMARAFVDLLEEHYRQQHAVGFYADRLHTTPPRLTNMLQQALGKSAKRIILDRLVLEARRLLHFTDMPVQTIAYTLGFADPFHFSKIIKRELGVAPQHYREARREHD